jgi:hypothetical protein
MKEFSSLLAPVTGQLYLAFTAYVTLPFHLLVADLMQKVNMMIS